MDSKTHWSGVYQAKAVTDVSWYQDNPVLSLDFIRHAAPDPAARIIDAGAGASTLADHLLDAGYRDLTLLDLSAEALDAVRRALKPGGHLILATFGPDGPTQCSGLPVARYDAQALHAELGEVFELLDSATETHRTPWGSEQQFTYILCRVQG